MAETNFRKDHQSILNSWDETRRMGENKSERQRLGGVSVLAAH